MGVSSLSPASNTLQLYNQQRQVKNSEQATGLSAKVAFANPPPAPRAPTAPAGAAEAAASSGFSALRGLEAMLGNMKVEDAGNGTSIVSNVDNLVSAVRESAASAGIATSSSLQTQLTQVISSAGGGTSIGTAGGDRAFVSSLKDLIAAVQTGASEQAAFVAGAIANGLNGAPPGLDPVTGSQAETASIAKQISDQLAASVSPQPAEPSTTDLRAQIAEFFGGNAESPEARANALSSVQSLFASLDAGAASSAQAIGASIATDLNFATDGASPLTALMREVLDQYRRNAA
jgi:hypothetical protein